MYYLLFIIYGTYLFIGIGLFGCHMHAIDMPIWQKYGCHDYYELVEYWLFGATWVDG